VTVLLATVTAGKVGLYLAVVAVGVLSGILSALLGVGGAVVTWLRDNLKLIAGASAVEAAARSEADAGGLTFVPAFNGLFAPYWRTDARGVLVGLSGTVGRAHSARATLEAVAHQSRQLLETMAAEAGSAAPAAALKVDGGMTANEMLIQFQADILDTVVLRPSFAEITAFGSALAAGLATGVWASEEEATQMQKAMCGYTEFAPSMAADKRQQRRAKWADAIQRSLNQA
jgi:glycerol kinase